MRTEETTKKVLDGMYCPFARITYTLPVPRPLWSSFQELSEVLSPGCSPHFTPNKTHLAMLTVCVILSRQSWRPVKRPRVASLLCLNSTRTPSLGTTSSPSSPSPSSGVQTNLGKSPLALGSPAEAEDPEFLFCFSNMGRGTRALPTDLAIGHRPQVSGDREWRALTRTSSLHPQ